MEQRKVGDIIDAKVCLMAILCGSLGCKGNPCKCCQVKCSEVYMGERTSITEKDIEILGELQEVGRRLLDT